MRTYTVKEIAELLGTNPETVRRWIRDGKLQAVTNSKKKGENKVILEGALNAKVCSHIGCPFYTRCRRNCIRRAGRDKCSVGYMES